MSYNFSINFNQEWIEILEGLCFHSIGKMYTKFIIKAALGSEGRGKKRIRDTYKGNFNRGMCFTKAKYQITFAQVCWSRAHWRKAMEIYQGPWCRDGTTTPAHLHIVQHLLCLCTARDELWSSGSRCFKRNNFWNSGSSTMCSKTRILLW